MVKFIYKIQAYWALKNLSLIYTLHKIVCITGTYCSIKFQQYYCYYIVCRYFWKYFLYILPEIQYHEVLLLISVILQTLLSRSLGWLSGWYKYIILTNHNLSHHLGSNEPQGRYKCENVCKFTC